MTARARLRDLGIVVGRLPTGRHNAITDVAGVRVGHATVIADAPAQARSGVTVVLPTSDEPYRNQVFAGFHRFNGFGEMTGVHWVEESGILASPIAITSTYSVGVMRDALILDRFVHAPHATGVQPLVAETSDAWLSDGSRPLVTADHLHAAMAAAKSGPVAEGNVGGGTGMICHEFKGGIGTSSRRVETPSGGFMVGALVQANYGKRVELTVAGVPVGRTLTRAVVPLPRDEDGSIIIIVATDAPLLPPQCTRLAQRATVGLGRVGGTGSNGSGDLFLAFSTGNRVPSQPERPVEGLRMLPNAHMTQLFTGVAEAVEEAIINAMCMAETMTGQQGRVVHALPLDRLVELCRAR
ncbi:L-aminopeptidase DmpA [Stella humosa]|uniref:L-aminopeptidase DmpA n=1 Tax=Stella humosa TaxID=94 RepID=A0A3N1M845_9PROT|nr:P1 family peptidase [Stella humosa]ROQ02002.1 L-aminopeptidase DmpA [Stella humosa]BBK32391.1 D-aminopeptidase [Stella humosa]